MKIYAIVVLIVTLLISVVGQTAMTDKQLYAASMENDAQFIECVGNIFLAVASFQRIILADLKWEPKNPEFQKIMRSRESLHKASANLSTALMNSDKLVVELSGEKKKKFGAQLSAFKSQVKDLDARLKKIISGIDQQKLPEVDGIHQILSLAIAGTGFGMGVSKKNAATKEGR